MRRWLGKVDRVGSGEWDLLLAGMFVGGGKWRVERKREVELEVARLEEQVDADLEGACGFGSTG